MTFGNLKQYVENRKSPYRGYSYFLIYSYLNLLKDLQRRRLAEEAGARGGQKEEAGIGQDGEDVEDCEAVTKDPVTFIIFSYFNLLKNL